jgi:hypothetical protein
VVKKPPLPFRPQTLLPRPFPTRGVPGGWRDAWDADPLAGLPPGRPTADYRRRSVRDPGLRAEIVAHARDDGRWVASVAAREVPPPVPGPGAGPTDRPTAPSAAAWPSVNGPTAAAALDALEAELRDAACGAPPDTEPALSQPEGR